MKKLEYAPLAKKLETQTEIAKKQYQTLDKIYKLGETIDKNDRKQTLKKYNKSDLACDAKHSFYKYRDIKKFDNVSFKSKYAFVAEIFNDQLNKLKTQKEKTEKKRKQKFMIQLQNYIMIC